MTEVEFIIFLCAWLVGGFVNGIAGFGAGMVALPIISSFMPMQIVVPVSSMSGVLICICLGWKYRKYISIKSLIPLAIGTLPGAILGASTLVYVSSETVQFAAGLAMLLFVTWQVIPKRMEKVPENSILAGTAGGISGFLNASISFGGPPVAIYAVSVGWSKEVTFANLNLALLMNAFMGAGAHAYAGLYSLEVLHYLMWSMPVTLLGVFFSFPIIKKINPILFQKILLTVIAIAGCICIIRVVL